MLKKIIDKYLKIKNIFIIYRMGDAIGDQLLLSGITKLIYQKYKYKIIVFNSIKEIFYNNNYIFKNYSFNYSSIFSRFLYKIFEYYKFEMIKNFSSGLKDNDGIFSLKNFKNLHLAQYHSLNLNLNIDYSKFKPEIYFSKKEEEIFKKKFVLPHNFAIVQATGKKSFTSNKEWGFHNFQNVINATKEEINWIQVSKPNDKQLLNIKHNYNNITLRELFYLIYKSKFVFCLEGLINHIAAAFEKKTYLILSGFVNEKHVKYKNNLIIENYKNLSCAPCYKLFDCDIEGKPCTSNILVETVINKIKANSTNE